MSSGTASGTESAERVGLMKHSHWKRRSVTLGMFCSSHLPLASHPSNQRRTTQIATHASCSADFFANFFLFDKGRAIFLVAAVFPVFLNDRFKSLGAKLSLCFWFGTVD